MITLAKKGACIAALLLILVNLCFAWDLEHDDDGIKIYTQDMESSSFKAFRGEVFIKSALRNVMAHHLDIESMELWLQDCSKSEIIRKISDKEFYVYQRTKAPWPVSDRDYVIHSKISQNPETFAVTVAYEASTAISKSHEDCVPITKLTGYWRYTPQGDGRIFVEYETHADPGGDLPSWLANSFVVDQPLGTLQKMRQRVENNSYELPEELNYIREPSEPIKAVKK